MSRQLYIPGQDDVSASQATSRGLTPAEFQVRRNSLTGRPRNPQDIREPLRVIVRALARAAAAEEHRRRQEADEITEPAQ